MGEQQSRTVFDAMNLRGRVALVTGAAGHLGQAMAAALAETGARVITTSRDSERSARVADSLPDPYGADHFGLELDQLDPVSIDRCAETAIERAGRIDVLVNNGHEATACDWTDVTADDFNRQLANATGYFLLARHVRNHAAQLQRSASIVMIGSMYGVVGSYPDAYEEIGPASPAAYHALKGGIVQLTRHLAVYWAKDKVRVNCLSPGPFPPSSVSPRLLERLKTKSPLSRMGEPHEIKGALVLLASDAGSYITGQNLIVDGGWTAW